MAKATRNFSSKGAYDRWVAAGHANGSMQRSKGNTPVTIKGKSYKPSHAGAKGKGK